MLTVNETTEIMYGRTAGVRNGYLKTYQHALSSMFPLYGIVSYWFLYVFLT